MELYAKMFVRTSQDVHAVVRVIAAATGGRVGSHTIDAFDHRVDVRTNDEFSAGAANADPPDFLAFPITLDIIADDEAISESDYVRRIEAIMHALNGAHMPVVAACDWEHLLPGGGKLGL
jgi:hypothetical protein